MKALNLFTILMPLLLPVFAASADAAFGKAIMIEIREYAGFPALRSGAGTLADDMAAIRDLGLLAGADTTLMSDDDDGTKRFPIKANLLREINSFSRQRGTGLFFYRGHAEVSGDRIFLAPADGQKGKPPSLLGLDAAIAMIEARGQPTLAILEIYVDSPAEVKELQTAMGRVRPKTLGLFADIMSDPAAYRTGIFADVAEALSGGGDLAEGANNDGSVSVAEAVAFLELRRKADTGPAASSVAAPPRENAIEIAKHAHAELYREAKQWVQDLQALTAESRPEGAVETIGKVSEALRLLERGDFDRGLESLVAASAEARPLAARAADQRVAEALKAEIDKAAKLAADLKAASQAPDIVARAATARNSGLAFLAQGKFARARQVLESACTGYHQAAILAVKKSLTPVTEACPRADIIGLGGAPGAEMIDNLDAASGAEKSQDFQRAADLYSQISVQLPQVKKAIADNLAQTAKRLAEPETYQAALAAVDRALLLRPGSPDLVGLSRQLRANFRFEPGQTYRTESGLALAYVPPGDFMMGSPEQENDRDIDEVQHEVTISQGFFIGVYEVTEAQWAKVTGKQTGDNSPVKPCTDLTCDEAMAFCRLLSEQEEKTYRLPTEAEWEYACRAGTATAYYLGTSISGREAAVFDPGLSLEGKRAIGSYPQANAWGLYDMHGNVWEWCSDWYCPYTEGKVTDPKGLSEDKLPENPKRVLRGGSWFDEPSMARCANRWASNPLTQNGMIGFRIVLEAADVE